MRNTQDMTSDSSIVAAARTLLSALVLSHYSVDKKCVVMQCCYIVTFLPVSNFSKDAGSLEVTNTIAAVFHFQL